MSTPASVAIITGAGSGIGRASALRLVKEGWRVALVGRRAEALAETAKLAGGAASVHPCDVADAATVKQVAAKVLAEFGRVDALVHCAGTNIARRSWEQLSAEDYRGLLAANLDGVFNCVQALLPAMRKQGAGTVVVINSEAGRVANAKAGAAYVVSKFGLAGLVQSLNAEERANGIRACSIFPGDVNTPLLDKRPVPPPPEARVKMLQPEDVAAAVWLAVSLPPRAIIEELIIRPA
jgi:NADP-dependent 3-hydroxy acid dehydrogenase YdfG